MAKKRRKRKYNPVREWISDNLRYILLILIIVIAALVAFLVYRGISGRSQKPGELTNVSVESTSAENASSASSAESESTAKTEVVTATPTPTPTETPTPTPTPEPTPEVELSEDTGEVTAAVQDYFYTVQVNGEYPDIEYYDNIHVQTVPGPEDGTYVAYADYEYKYWNYGSTIPGLTEFYLETDENGALQMVDNVPSDVQSYISEIRQTESVQSLIRSIQDRYQEVLDADPDLAAYISGLG